MENNKPAITRREVNIFREILGFLNDTRYTLHIQSDGDLNMRRLYSTDIRQIKSAVRYHRYMIVLDENNKVVRRYNFYMELRSYNVRKVWADSVTCRLGSTIGVTEQFERNKPHIISLVSQIARKDRKMPLKLCNLRKDGEYWTPYLQIVEMIILMGKRCNLLTFQGELRPNTIIEFMED